ncbi:MAG TPA: PaaI family thioesterase [Actinomycetota bacterium]
MTGIDLVEFGIGTATFRLPASGWLHSPAGLITGGAMAFVADGALGTAILSTLPPQRILATSDLALNFLRPPADGSTATIARGRVIQVGRSQALSEAAVEDDTGRFLAHATSRCVISEVPGPLPKLAREPLPGRTTLASTLSGVPRRVR